VKDINIFCFGFGQVAKNFLNKINSEGYKINLSATSRSKTSKKIFNGISYQNYLFDNENYDKDLLLRLTEVEHILVSIPPKEGKDLVIKNFSKFIKSPKVKWITYLSATSVYGDHKGEWVDENSETKPKTNNGISRLNAENSWLALSTNSNLPVQIFRLSGIYSNESNILMRLKLGEVKLVNKKNHYFSRIHVQDISNILFKSLSNFKSREIYNLSDDKPSSAEEVTLYGAKILNIKDLKKIEVDEIDSEMLKNFYRDSKKVSNKKIKKNFDYSFKFPTYMEGLNYIRDNFI
jgi:nucleoside-diphosphate-sugar epimerase